MSTQLICSECVTKKEQIYRLRENIKQLPAKLRRQQQKISEGYFGSSTPSSNKPIKPKTQNYHPNKNGGAKRSHIGNQ